MMKRPPRWALVFIAAGMLAGQTRETNPHTSPQDVSEGRRLYALFCVFCHGMDGASGRGARLATEFRRHGTSDRDQYRVIANGISGTEMSGHFLEEDEIWRILSFVRTLEASARKSGAACAASPGDVTAGRRLMADKGCLTCHSITSNGTVEGSGRRGPDLSTIGASRTRAQLRESLVDPAKSVPPAYRSVKVTAGDKSYTGILMNQDEYTVHLMDATEQVRSFQRRDVRVEFPQGSSMPPYGSLPAAELDSLLSYLCSLNGGAK